MRRFRSSRYRRQTLTFYPAPFQPPLRPFAVLVFAWKGDRVLICQIKDRGWCVPSGRIEALEDTETAARRESHEEAGATLGDMLYIGTYLIRERREVRWAACYVTDIVELNAIPEDSESSACCLKTMDELPELYHVWNELTEQVFSYSYEVLCRYRKLHPPDEPDGGKPD